MSLTRDGQRPEHLIVAASEDAPGFVDRPGYRLTIERLSPPWLMLRVDEVDDELEIHDGDLMEL